MSCDSHASHVLVMMGEYVSYSSMGGALTLECRVSWVRVPSEAAHFSFGKVTALGVLCCFALLFV